MNLVYTFIYFWNRRALKNGKTKFKNQREASDYMRKLHNDSSGPTFAMARGRENYKAMLSAQRDQDRSGLETGPNITI